MNDNPFEIKEEACASSPDHRRYLLIQAVDTETGEIVWAVGDDQICAVTRADFIRTPEIRYEDDGSLSKEELRQLRRIHAAAARFQAELQREMEKRHVPTAKRLSAGCRSQKDGEYDALI
ncbi:hypothetical protein [Flavonifractor plautii]|uniref:hypothetical protein n=1 Tax=Flavonifractor plautii TaxID=292800 RepID=UPI00189863F6|nr:hypothetical protein [Flavonifractor plautii]